MLIRKNLLLNAVVLVRFLMRMMLFLLVRRISYTLWLIILNVAPDKIVIAVQCFGFITVLLHILIMELNIKIISINSILLRRVILSNSVRQPLIN